MNKYIKKLLIVYSVLIICGLDIYCVDVVMELVRKTSYIERINLGIINFMPIRADMKEIELARKIQEVVRQDLLFTRYFNIIESNIQFSNRQEDFIKLRNQSISVLLTATVKKMDTGCQLLAKLYDVTTGECIFEKIFIDTQDNYRSLAHELNDTIVEKFTGERGIAHTKIVFSNNSTGYKEIYVIDYDGYNLKRLTDDKSINLLPRWSPDGKKIIYTTYKYRNPDLYIMNADGTNKKALSTYQGLNTPAAFSPDGKNIAISLSKGESPNIYLIDLSGKIVRQITRGPTIDTSPWFSPNGHQLVFVSGRAGIPQLYLTDIEGTNIRRLTTEGYSDSPAWSPKGGLIVFAMRSSNSSYFDIYLYAIEVQQYRALTSDTGGTNENPSFSPDGRYIVFSTNRNGKYEIFTMFIDGSGQRRISSIKGNSHTPCWSP